ncbi:radical SAM protein [Ruminiclostridium cellulolyticum]|uniref:Radical SAM domain protein n=1 Tax=Ruminiclostridium cellulolyticum (strain ATCC 35319 / DSM 5812 / JCM 6584 / H10) TaxID=394503 RepID=B8HZZ9_RUMCH|nr:radical SAM protein [Ruminiclostridium cellulolyticum]ACL75499.1 Radical SAM domain protein [Ruminiclostridium cellulolyticum H10]
MDRSSLSEYMSRTVENIVSHTIRSTLKNPKETAFLIKYLFTTKIAAARRLKSEKAGLHIPPFLIASITKSCNLRCSGCYARELHSCSDEVRDSQMTCQRWNEIFREAESLGISFILLAGGEPLMRRDVVVKAADSKNIIFPIFTNGLLMNNFYIDLFNKNRNLIPVLSIEGYQEETDQRRGQGTYKALLEVMGKLDDSGIIYGTSVTVTTQNIEEVSGKKFIDILSNLGCKIIFYVEYVPAEEGTDYLAPTEKERESLAERLTGLQSDYKDILFLSFPGDEKATGGCLAAGRGFFHINADGGAEPCPFSPQSDTNLREVCLKDALKSPLFARLDSEGLLLGEHRGGCMLFEKKAEVDALMGL